VIATAIFGTVTGRAFSGGISIPRFFPDAAVFLSSDSTTPDAVLVFFAVGAGDSFVWALEQIAKMTIAENTKILFMTAPWMFYETDETGK
jgi:hypothetical protein